MFLKGHQATDMFFILSGVLSYRLSGKAQGAEPFVQISGDQWLAEAALWISNWVYHGTLTAVAASELVSLSSEAFRTVMGLDDSMKGMGSYVTSYVTAFLELECVAQDHAFRHTDLWGCHEDLYPVAQNL